MMSNTPVKSMVRWSVVAGTLGVLALLVAACGSDPTATPVATATPTSPPAEPTATLAPGEPTPTPAPTATPTLAPPAWQIEWDETLAAAKEEGKVVIALGGNASRTYSPRFEAFEAEMGIEVIAGTGGGSVQFAKISAEREAGVFTTDVWMTGVTSTKNVNSVGALKDNISDHLILADVVDPNTWVDGHLWFPNGLEDTTIAFCASPNVAFAYNTDLVDASQLTSWWDLVDGRFKGQWVGKLPWEPGQTDSEHFINKPELGEAFIRAFILDQDAEWVADAQQAVDLLAKGVKSIFMPTGNASSDIEALESFGLPVKNHFAQGFKEGGVIGIGGLCSLSLLNDPPHPNAQKVFLNWWLTKENQYAAGGINGLSHSLRVDVPTDNLLENYIRKEGVEYFFPEADPSVPTNNPGLAFNRQLADEAGLR